MQGESRPRRDHPDSTGAPAGPHDPVRLPVEPLAELGGDQACWLSRVCTECGRLTEGRDPRHCASCGEPLPD